MFEWGRQKKRFCHRHNIFDDYEKVLEKFNNNDNIFSMLYLADWLFDSGIKQIDNFSFEKETLNLGIQALHKEWSMFFLNRTSMLKMDKNEFENLKQIFIKIIRALVNIVYHVKVITVNGLASLVLEKDLKTQMMKTYNEAFGYFYYDGEFVRHVVQSNRNHSLFFHYLLICRGLSGFEERVVAKLEM